MSIRKNIILAASALAVVAGSAAAASAAPNCTAEPQAKWMPEQAMKDIITGKGYTIKEFKVSGSCYEFYGKSKDGKRAEIYYNPMTGAAVKQKLG